MADEIGSTAWVKPRIRRKAISLNPGIERYDPNTGDWDIWGVSKTASDIVDRMAEQRGILNGEMLCIIMDHQVLAEQLDAERKLAIEWLALENEKSSVAKNKPSANSHLRQSVRSKRKKSMPPSSDGIPFMITKEMRDQLEKLGYDAKDIHEMTPAQAHQILKG